ncbi:MAG: phospholipase D-like domain-containing protein [Myxococcota bacterium]
MRNRLLSLWLAVVTTACTPRASTSVADVGHALDAAVARDAGMRADAAETRDATSSDANTGDAGDPDERPRDAGTRDATLVVTDAGDTVEPPEPDEPDAGIPDAATGVPDAAGPVDATPPPAVAAYFNAPHGDDQPDDTLELVLKELLSHAAVGSQVRVSLFTLTRGTMAQAFVAAFNRGVDVRLVLDGHNATYAAYQTLVDGLGAERITLCGTVAAGSCIGTGINHSKFYLFSQLDDGTANVVVQSSANLSSPMLKEHNNLVVVRDDAALYSGYLDVWQDQQAQARNDDYYRVVVGDRPIRTYFYPRAQGDTVVSVLSNVSCGGGGRVLLAMSLFTNARVAIADRLAELKGQGCDVQALLRDDGTTPGDAIVNALADGNVPYRRITQTATRSTIHSKILIIDAPYDTGSGPTRRKLVFTGSHNYTGGALTDNDEQLMRVDSLPVFEAYLANWNAIRATVP